MFEAQTEFKWPISSRKIIFAKTSLYEKRVAETELRTTLECLAQSLSDPENGLEYTENMGIAVVKDRIMQTISAHREKKHAVGLQVGLAVGCVKVKAGTQDF